VLCSLGCFMRNEDFLPCPHSTAPVSPQPQDPLWADCEVPPPLSLRPGGGAGVRTSEEGLIGPGLDMRSPSHRKGSPLRQHEDRREFFSRL
jgi:hypothetical protein